MKINLPIFKDEDTKVVLGFNGVSLHWVPRLHPSSLCYLFPTRLPRGAGEKCGDRHYPR